MVVYEAEAEEEENVSTSVSTVAGSLVTLKLWAVTKTLTRKSVSNSNALSFKLHETLPQNTLTLDQRLHFYVTQWSPPLLLGLITYHPPFLRRGEEVLGCIFHVCLPLSFTCRMGA